MRWVKNESMEDPSGEGESEEGLSIIRGAVLSGANFFGSDGCKCVSCVSCEIKSSRSTSDMLDAEMPVSSNSVEVRSETGGRLVRQEEDRGLNPVGIGERG